MSMKVTGIEGEEWEIQKSPIALNLKIKFFSITYVFIAIVAIIILLIPFNFLDANFSIWATIIIFITVILFVLSLWYLKADWQRTRYAITDHGVTICHGVGFFKEEVYRLESIVSARVRQGYIGNHFGYGDVVLDIPKLQSQPDVVLRSIDHPAEVLQTFRDKIQYASEGSSGSGAAMIM